MALRITLRDGERVIVNGAVLSVVGRTELRVENKVAILRGREIMDPQDAITPAKALYFHTMMAYIDPDGSDAHHDRIIERLQHVSATLSGEQARIAIVSFANNVAALSYYRALADCRALIAAEAEEEDSKPSLAAAG